MEATTTLTAERGVVTTVRSTCPDAAAATVADVLQRLRRTAVGVDGRDTAGPINERASMREAAELLAHSRASDLAVVDDDGNYIGVLSEGDLLFALIPDFEGLLEADVSLSEAFEIFVCAGGIYADEPVSRLVIREPITLTPDDRLLTAATVMITRNIRRLPVVVEGRLVGTVARADICWALFGASPADERAA